jgi:signal transduction histidine kinase/ligand-binding sensor domain-containing protein
MLSVHKYINCFALLLAFVLAANAQYRFDHWTTENGLPQNSVRKILQTSDGYIWMTTLDGLVRYDGVRFTVFNRANSKGLASNRFINLFAEPDDTLWAGTEENGIARFRHGEFRMFNINDGLPSPLVSGFELGHGGNLNVQTLQGGARLEGEQFVQTFSKEEITSMRTLHGRFDTDWKLDAHGLTADRDGETRVFELPAEMKQLMPADFNYYSSMSLYEDARGTLWIMLYSAEPDALKTAAWFRLAGGAAGGAIERVKYQGQPSSPVAGIVNDRHGDLWVATFRDGVCRLSAEKFTCFNTTNGLATGYITSIISDREGTLWFSTEEKGIYRIGEQIISPFAKAQGLDGLNAYSVLEDSRGAIWIGSIGGLARYADGKVTNYSANTSFKYEDVVSLCETRDGRLFIGSYSGIQYLENGKFHDFSLILGQFNKDSSVSAFDIHEDRNGVLWFATNHGLLRYDGSSVKFYTTADGLPTDMIKVIVENEDGSFWIGTPEGIALFKDEKFTAYSDKDGMGGNHVRAIYKDPEGILWVGTYDSGLSRFKDGKFTNYTVESGLSSNGVFQISEDANRNFWISSNQGIYRVSRDQLNEFAEGKRALVTSTLFGKSDGMLTAEANGGGQPAGATTRDGRIWFPTQDGIAIIDPNKIKVNDLPPPVTLEKIRIDNRSLTVDKNGIELLPSDSNLEIDYTGLSFVKPEQVRFRYRLERTDETWTEAGNRRTAFYPHLAPGDYTFHVIAANSDNVWNEEGARVRITVHPPFYRRWWFIALMAFLAGGTIVAFYRRRVSQLERKRAAQQAFARQLIASQEQERKRIAAELHDSLGQRLVVIKNLALMFLNVPNATRDQSQIENISAEASQAIGEVKEISYNLRPYQLDRIGLTKAIEAIVRTAKAASTIEITSEIDADIDEYFPRDAEINFYRIVQESVGNLVKHSGATRAFVKIELSGAQLDLAITDNGAGFVPGQTESKSGGFGLLGIAERVELFGGKLDVRSAPGQGTTVRVKLNSANFDK